MKEEDLKTGRRYWFVSDDESKEIITGYYTGKKRSGKAIIIDDNCITRFVNPNMLLDKNPK